MPLSAERVNCAEAAVGAADRHLSAGHGRDGRACGAVSGPRRRRRRDVGGRQSRYRVAVWLYGARLSPQQAWQGVKRWQLHLLVLATTFVVFPVLGLAARGLVPWLLNLDLYNGLLFLCLVPSTVQSSIAFTSIARGNVSAALVSASLSNIVGMVLTPLLVVLLMNTRGGLGWTPARFATSCCNCCCRSWSGQLMRPWIADWVARHVVLTKAVDRGSILLIVYTAFSIGMVEHIWRSVDAVAAGDRRGRQHRAVGGGAGIHLADRSMVRTGSRRQHRAAVLRLEKESGVWSSDGAGVLPGRHRRRDHVAADDLSPDTAGGVLGDRQQAVPRCTGDGPSRLSCG